MLGDNISAEVLSCDGLNDDKNLEETVDILLIHTSNC